MTKVSKNTIIYRSFGSRFRRITENAFNLGADYYILKPFDNQMLLNRIKHVRRAGERRRYVRSGGSLKGQKTIRYL